MKILNIFAAGIVSLALLAGCQKSEEKAKEGAAPAAAPSAPAQTPAPTAEPARLPLRKRLPLPLRKQRLSLPNNNDCL